MLHTRNALSLVAVLFASVTLGCAGAAISTPTDRAAALLSDAPAPAGRTCTIATQPSVLPAIASIVDTAGLQRALTTEFESALPAGAFLFSVRFARDGTLEWVAPVGTEPVQPAHARIQRLIRDNARWQPPSDAPRNVRVRVVPDDASQNRVGRSEICRSVVSIGSRTPLGPEAIAPIQGSQLRRPRRSSVGVDVGATGEVLRIQVLQSSGNHALDDAVLEWARVSEYSPALVDGIPVESCVIFGGRTRVRPGFPKKCLDP